MKEITPELSIKLRKIVNFTVERIKADTPIWDLNESIAKERMREAVKAELGYLMTDDFDLKLVYEENERIIEEAWSNLGKTIELNQSDSYKEIPPYTLIPSDNNPKKYQQDQFPQYQQQFKHHEPSQQRSSGQYERPIYQTIPHMRYQQPKSYKFGIISLVAATINFFLIFFSPFVTFYISISGIILGGVGIKKDSSPVLGIIGIILNFLNFLCPFILLLLFIPY